MTRSLGLYLVLLTSAPARAADPPVDFGRDVLPILSDNCFFCHGPDEKARKAQLRLDTKDGAFRVRDGEAVIIPGKGGQSELIRRLTAEFLVSEHVVRLSVDPADAVRTPPQYTTAAHLTLERCVLDRLDRLIGRHAPGLDRGHVEAAIAAEAVGLGRGRFEGLFAIRSGLQRRREDRGGARLLERDKSLLMRRLQIGEPEAFWQIQRCCLESHEPARAAVEALRATNLRTQ